MKKLMTLLLLSVVMFSCEKQQTQSTTAYTDPTTTAKSGTVNYTNPNPTWIQVTSPALLPAKWSAYFVPAGYTAGVSAPQDNNIVPNPDTTVVVKWHLHVGLRNFNSLLKPDVIDYREYIVNALYTNRKPIPNGGVMGDYDFIDTVTIVRNGYCNAYFLPYNIGLGYNWNSITPQVHSAATNGTLYSIFWVGVPQ